MNLEKLPTPEVVYEMSLEERQNAAKQFGIEASKQWPHSAEEASSWVEGEYLSNEVTPVAIKVENEVIGAAYILPFSSVLETFPEGKISQSLRDFASEHLNETVFAGGAYVKGEHQGRGHSITLTTEIEQKAREQGYKYLICITGIPNANHPLRMLPTLLQTGWKILKESQVSSRSYDIEEAWLIKEI